MANDPPAKELELYQEVLSGTSARIVIAIVGFIGSVYFAQKLGPALFGTVSLIYTLAEWFSHPLYGVGAAAKKRVSEIDSDRGVLFGLLILVGGVWILIIGIVAIGISPILKLPTEISHIPLYIIGLVATVGMFTVFGRLVEGRGQVGAFLWTNAFRKICVVGLQSLLLYWGFGVSGWIAGAVFASIIAMFPIYSLIDARPRFPDRDILESVWEFAQYSSLTSTIYAGYSRLDLFLIGIIMGSSFAGYYEIAWKITMFGVLIPNVIGNSLMAKISALSANGNYQNIPNQVKEGAEFASIITIPLLFGAVAIGEPMITIIYGREYAPAADLLIAVAVVRIIDSQSDPVIAAIGGIDRPDITLKLTVIGIVLNIIIGLPILYIVGPIGLIMVSAVSESIRWIGGVVFLRRRFDSFVPIGLQHCYQLISATIMFSTTILLYKLMYVDNLPTIFFIIGVGASVYAITIFVLSEKIQLIVRNNTPLFNRRL